VFEHDKDLSEQMFERVSWWAAVGRAAHEAGKIVEDLSPRGRQILHDLRQR